MQKCDYKKRTNWWPGYNKDYLPNAQKIPNPSMKSKSVKSVPSNQIHKWYYINQGHTPNHASNHTKKKHISSY